MHTGVTSMSVIWTTQNSVVSERNGSNLGSLNGMFFLLLTEFVIAILSIGLFDEPLNLK